MSSHSIHRYYPLLQCPEKWASAIKWGKEAQRNGIRLADYSFFPSTVAALKYTGFKKESTISVVEREKGQEMGCRFYWFFFQSRIGIYFPSHVIGTFLSFGTVTEKALEDHPRDSLGDVASFTSMSMSELSMMKMSLIGTRFRQSS